MTTEQLIKELVAAWNTHDPGRVAAWYTENCSVIDVAIATPLVGRQAVRSMFEGYFCAFPDLEIVPEDIVIEDNRVALFWSATATHLGPIMNIPPSGRHVRTHGVNRLVMEGKQVRETWTIWDVAGVLRGIGLLPDL